MRPTATAAAESDSVSVGSTQNGVGHEKAKKPAKHNQTKTSAHGWPGTTLAVKNTPVNAIPTTQCHFRSPVRSDDWPDSQTPARPQK